ncbi:MAG: alanine--glyoxylate aminotransferase family protein [Bdellovibrionales bacterium]|nr:alanine--glyoxylate aminotransferase family protein [Bdellovibrionales bacterium]
MFFKHKNPYRLLTPGPVPLHPDVERALSEPMIHHRTPEFERCLKSVTTKLKETFATRESVFIHTATGSGAMESALVNTLSPGDEVLCIVSGKFGERWAEMASTFGLKTHLINVSWGEAVDPSVVEAELSKNKNIKAVLTQACETSTATVHPIRELGTIIKQRPQTLFMIDAITAVGAMMLEMDDWGLDVVIGGSQKAFMLPTGLSFIALSKKAWGFYESSTLPKFYWDLKREQKCLEKGETHFSSAVPLIRALDVALDHLTGQNKMKTLARIQTLAQATREAASHLGLTVYSKSPSPSVTALLTPPGVDSQKLRTHIEKEYNLTLMGGQEQLKGKILRVGHLGYITNEDMFALFDILYNSLRDFSLNAGEGYTLHRENLDSANEVLKKYLQ